MRHKYNHFFDKVVKIASHPALAGYIAEEADPLAGLFFFSRKVL